MKWWMSGINVAALRLLFGHGTMNARPLPRSIPPNTQILLVWLPRLYFLFMKQDSSTSTTDFVRVDLISPPNRTLTILFSCKVKNYLPVDNLLSSKHF